MTLLMRDDKYIVTPVPINANISAKIIIIMPHEIKAVRAQLVHIAKHVPPTQHVQMAKLNAQKMTICPESKLDHTMHLNATIVRQ